VNEQSLRLQGQFEQERGDSLLGLRCDFAGVQVDQNILVLGLEGCDEIFAALSLVLVMRSSASGTVKYDAPAEVNVCSHDVLRFNWKCFR
jgi:hypothetical protein